ncbi:S-adenosyl-L-methionine-dependent methyltransferase [Apiospora aurea]|uniref:S-adenosyl-L-methionine-dependent methyltransferase n=1 Tax=Apiospora aurea TaxID=335848 RepID=A0ABR1QEE9_9PEZI
MPTRNSNGPIEETARHGSVGGASISGGSGSGVANSNAGPTRKRSIVQNGRRFYSDPTLAYPFPIDLKETHRQTLSTLLRLRLNGGCPVLRSDELVGTGTGAGASLSSSVSSVSSQQQHQNFKPPRRVLEVGCGSGVWSMLCHRYFVQHGHNAVSFVGLDIRGGGGGGGGASTSTSNISASNGGSSNGGSTRSGGSSNGAGRGGKDEEDAAVGPPALVDEDCDDMYWQFVQHDCRQAPWPLESAAFDLVVFKDMSTAFTQKELAAVTDELVRVLRPGGVLEVWDVDSVLRSLKPNAPDSLAANKGRRSGSVGGGSGSVGSSSPGGNNNNNNRNHRDHRQHQSHSSQQQQKKQQEKDDAYAELGVYDVDANILGPSSNPYIVEYNGWLSQACDARTVSPVPCATIGPFLVQEAETLEGMISKRFAVPLSTDIGWEKRHQRMYGGGGGRSGSTSSSGEAAALVNAERAAIRDTARQCVVDLIGTWEPMLRSVNKMSQESWDAWYAKATKNLMLEGGADRGECLEVGVWSVRKKKNR